MKKVLFVARVASHIRAFHLPIIDMLQRQGLEVHVATNYGEEQTELAALGVVCHQIDFNRNPFSWRSVVVLWQLIRLMTEVRFDLVHVHTPIAAFLARAAAKWTNTKPVLYTAHGFHFYSGAGIGTWLLYGTMEKIAAKWTDGLIVINQEDYETAKNYLAIAAEKLFYVHGVGVNIAEMRSAQRQVLRAKLGVGKGTLAVICVAELCGNKNHRLLLQAWRIISAKYRQTELLLVGDGECRAELQAIIDVQKIPRVRLLGFRRDIPELLTAADIATLVSMREGLPCSVMEAMAAGLPVVASDVRGNRELVADGENGFLVDSHDINAMAQAYERLLTEPALRRKMGEAGRRKVEAYSLQTVLQEMQPIYKRYLLY